MEKTFQNICPNLLSPGDKYFHLDQDILDEKKRSTKKISPKREKRPYSFHRKNKLVFKAKRIKMSQRGETGWFHGSPRWEWNKETGKHIAIWTHLRRPNVSKRKSFLKRQSARKIRRTEDVPQRCGSQKLFDYWWELI